MKIIEYLSPGVLVAILVALGSSWWTRHLIQIEADQREKAVLLLLHDEIESNLNILKTNDGLLDLDLQSIQSRKSLLHPLIQLETNSVDLLKIQMPEKMLAQKNQILRSLHTAMIKAKLYNVTLSARDNHRVHLGQLKNYGELLEGYDKALVADGRELAQLLQQLIQVL